MNQKFKQEYELVDMPEKNRRFKPTATSTYVYHLGKGYRNEKGQPTSTQICIGILDKESGKLIPNDNYFEIYGGRPTKRMVIDSIQNFGDYFLVNEIVEEIGLARVIRNVFGGMGEDVILLAIYFVLTGLPMYRCDGWCRETMTGKGILTSPQISRMLKEIDNHKRMEFFRAWVHARQQHEYLAYDVTSISSYSRGNDLVEYGYNRDGERLPQINIGMYYGEESRLPIFYCTYKGSIVDKSHLKYMMQHNKTLGIKDVSFVMDRGFYKEENVTSLSHEHRYIIGISNSLKISKEMITEYGEEVMSSRNILGSKSVRGIAIPDSRYGYRSNIMLYYSKSKDLDEDEMFIEKINRREQELLEGKPESEKGEDYFFVSVDSDSNRIVERNHDAIDEYLNNQGYFLMMTTDLRKTPDEVLEIYRMKDVIEKSFDDLKNAIEMKRLRVHSSEAMEGKMFVAFIALIIRAYLFNKLSEYLDKTKSSLAEVLDELRMIKVVQTEDGLLLCNPATKRQRTILECFDKSEDDLKDAVQQLNPSSFFDL
jgi:transposase